MATLSSLIKAIEARLVATAGLKDVAVVPEDPMELETQISKALDEVGMLILIGQPRWRNLRPESQAGEFEVTVEIAVGEAPMIWRLPDASRPACVDVAALVTARLQAWKPDGFRYLTVQQGDPVSDKKRQIYSVLAGTKWILPPG